MTRHTKTPYTAQGVQVVITPNNQFKGFVIATCHELIDGCSEKARANAKFIAKTCNEAKWLKRQVQRLTQELKEARQSKPSARVISDYYIIDDKVRYAIQIPFFNGRGNTGMGFLSAIGKGDTPKEAIKEMLENALKEINQ